jgi:hypothetical protein
MREGRFTPQTDDMVVKEIEIFLETLDGITSTITSDHIINLLEEITGTLPEDKEKMLHVIKRYQELSDPERLIYRVGRRGGAYRSTEDLKKDPDTRDKIHDLIQDIESKEGLDGIERFITDMADRYI